MTEQYLYLDHCAIRTITENKEKWDGFKIFVKKYNYVLLLSWVNVFEILNQDDGASRRNIINFIDSGDIPLRWIRIDHAEIEKVEIANAVKSYRLNIQVIPNIKKLVHEYYNDAVKELNVSTLVKKLEPIITFTERDWIAYSNVSFKIYKENERKRMLVIWQLFKDDHEKAINKYTGSQLNMMRKIKIREKMVDLLKETGNDMTNDEFDSFYDHVRKNRVNCMPLVFLGEDLRDMYRRDIKTKIKKSDYEDFFHAHVPCSYCDLVVLDGNFSEYSKQVKQPPRKAKILSLKEFRKEL